MDTRKDLIARGIIVAPAHTPTNRQQKNNNQKRNQAARAAECQKLKDLRNSNRK